MEPLASQEILRLLGEIKELVDDGFDWSALFAAMVGGGLTLIGGLVQSYMGERSKESRDKRVLLNGLIAEMSALREIATRRRYLDTFEEIQKLGGVPGSVYEPFTVYMPDSLAPVYSANVQHLGLLDEGDASQIIRFHQLVVSVVQDIKSEGIFGQEIEPHVAAKAAEEAGAMLREAMEIAAAFEARAKGRR